jgi:hypothetical protein
VSTPTGVAVIQTIHRQDYAAGPHSNPYVIPAGQFGATQKLYISPRHRVAVDGRMIEARDLNIQQDFLKSAMNAAKLHKPVITH